MTAEMRMTILKDIDDLWYEDIMQADDGTGDLLEEALLAEDLANGVSKKRKYL
jgi:hypothetical protein